MNLRNTPEYYTTLILVISATTLLIYQYANKVITGISPFNFSFVLFLIVFFLGYTNPQLSQVIINVTLLALGIYNLWNGIKSDSLGILNFGLIVITTLIICRFFDTDLSFIARGILFILIGSGFFAANYSFLKKRKAKDITSESSNIN
jgi:hypothetical protein